MPSNSDPKTHHRQSTRAPGYDYTRPGAYFVTMVTHRRDYLFGEVVDGEMHLNKNGQILDREWERLPRRFTFIELGTHIVMPTHFHGILIIKDIPRSMRARPPENNDESSMPNGPKPQSLGAIVGQLKSRVTKQIWKNTELNKSPIWQRNYHDHIILDDDDLNRIHRYIIDNPLNWNLESKDIPVWQ